MPEKYAKLARVGLYGFWAANIVLFTLVWAQERLEDLGGGGGDALIALGTLAALIGYFCLLTQLVLISGVRPVERPFGLDRLSRMHHRNGLVGYTLIMTHVTFMIVGYSMLTGNSLWEQYFELRDRDFVALASIALLALNAVVVSSVYIVWKHLRYEWWRTVHWLVYAVIVFSFFHQVNNGHELLEYDGFRAYWNLLFVVALGSVIYMRWLRPLYLYRKFRFRVDRVEEEALDVTSVYITGDRIERFKYSAGQFNFWYFWQPGFRLQKHPFTISSSPGDPYLRLSAKAIGDYTAELSKLKPGTPALVNGPFGRFTMAVAGHRPRLFIAGGIGITPIRSLLGHGLRDTDALLYAARSRADIAFREDIDNLAKQGLSLHYILSDERVNGAAFEEGKLDEKMLKRLVPDVAERDVWLCGPPPMMNAVENQLIGLGVGRNQIHTERFRLG